MSQKWFNNIDLQQNELQNGVIQNLAADPTSGKAGQIYYNTVDKGYRYHNGTAWVSITAEAVKSIKAGNGLTSTGTDTVTISLGDPSASGYSGADANTYGSNSVTAESHTHQIKLPDASTTAKGVIELATDAEATAGTDTTRAINAKQLAAAKQSAIDSAKVTIQTSNGITGGSTTAGNSFTLSGVDASTAAKGVVQLATQAEVNTGTDTSKVVTPSTLGKGKASGVASLDANGKIILSQIPDAVYGNVLYGGNLTEFTEEDLAASVSISSSLRARLGLADTVTTITIANATSSSITGEYGYASLEGVYFICEAAGSWGLTGSFEVGDWMISTGTSWQKVDNTDAVKSVNGQTGNVNITRVNEAGTADKVANPLTFHWDFTGTGTPLTSFVTYDGSAVKKIVLDHQFLVTSSSEQAKVQIGTVAEANHATSADKVANALTFTGTDGRNVESNGTFDGSSAKRIIFNEEDFLYPASAPTGMVLLRNTGVTAGTYNNVTVDAKGRVVSASNIKTSVVSEITGNGTQKEFNITHSLGKNVIVQVFLNGQQIGSDTADELVGVDVYTTSEKVKLVFATAPSTSQKFKVVISSGGNGVESLTPTAADDNKVAIADSTSATGWKFGKVGTNNLDKTSILNLVYPVGSIYMSANNVSPQTFLGGTWVAWGAGRVPVGVDSSDTDFNTAEKTGGEKTHRLSVDEMPWHDHSGTNSTVETETIHTRPTGGALLPLGINTYTVKYDVNEQTQEYMVSPAGGQTLDVENGTVINSQYGVCPNGLGVAHNNLQPYITCYMWKRTA